MMLRTLTLKSLAAALVATTACGVALPATAAIIVNDTWIDGTDTDPASPTFSEHGTDTDADGDIESAWFFGGGATLAPVGAGGPLRFALPSGSTSSASATTYFTPEGSEVNLAQGEILKVTWIFTPINVNVSNTSQNFRIALVDSPAGSRVTTDNAAPGSAAYTGYGIFANMGQTLNHSGSFRLMERSGASGAFLGTGGDWAAIGLTGATSGNTGYVSGTEYTFTMSIQRTLLDELQIDATMAGGNLDNDGLASVSFLDTTPNNGSFKFDTFGIRPSGATTTAETFDTRLFRVEVVPEPATFALIGLAGVLLAGVARRRR